MIETIIFVVIGAHDSHPQDIVTRPFCPISRIDDEQLDVVVPSGGFDRDSTWTITIDNDAPLRIESA